MPKSCREHRKGNCTAELSAVPDQFQAAGLNRADILGDFLLRPVPPFHVQLLCDRPVVKPSADGPGGNAAHDCIRRHIFRDDRAGADNGAVADGDTCKDNGLKSDPYIVSDADLSPVVPAVSDLLFIRFPLFKFFR